MRGFHAGVCQVYGYPNGRQHLSAEALCQVVRTGVATLPDHRAAEAAIPFTDALMAAFALCSLTSPSRLALDQHRAEGHRGPVSSIGRVPGDTPRRARLDPVSPESRRPVCKRVCRQVQRGNALAPMACLEGHSLVALEGTGDVSSTTSHGASGLHTVPRHGTLTYAHQWLGAASIPPDGHAVLPLRPEALVQPEGPPQNEGDRHAAKRLVTTRRQDHPHLPCILTDDRLRSHAPHLQTRQDPPRHSMLGVTAGAQAFLCQPVQAAEPTGHVTADERHARAAGLVHRVRWVHQVPLQASHADGRGKFMEDWEISTDQGQPCSWVTDLGVTQRPVGHVMRGGRARGKSANETFNTVTHQGDNFAHHDGHGTKHLSGVCAMVLRLASLVDQTPPRGGA